MADFTILLVDDSPNVLKALVRVFRSEDYNLLLAHSGKEALDVLAVNKVDLIITDENMPGMSGTDLLRVARESYPDVIRFMVTGADDIAVAKNAINNGEIYRFFTKPWDNFELVVCVKQALAHRMALLENARLRETLITKEAELHVLEQQFPGIAEKKLTQDGAYIIEE